MYALYTANIIFIALVAPMFFAIALPLITSITVFLGYDKQNFFKSLNHPVFYLSILISISLVVISFNSIKLFHSLLHALQFSLLLISFTILWCMRPTFIQSISSVHKKIILIMYIISLCILCTMNIAVLLDWVDWSDHKLNRQAVVFALFLWPLSLCLYEKQYTNIIVLIYLLTLAMILLGFSETALLMFFCSSLAFLIIKYASSTKLIRNSLFTIMVLTITFVPIIIASLNSSLLINLSKPVLGNKLHHLQVWITASKNVIPNLPIGLGPHTTQFLHESKVVKEPELIIHHPHNFVMELGLDLGILGVIILALCLYGAINIFRKSHTKDQPAIAAALISILILFSLSFSIWQEWRTGFVALALVSINRYMREQNEKAEPVSNNSQKQTTI